MWLWITPAVVIVLAGGIVLLVRHNQPHVTLPSSLAGVSQIHGPAFDAARAQADRSMGANAPEHALGWYGNRPNGQPRFAVFAEVVRYPNNDPFLAAPAGAPTSGIGIDTSKETNWGAEGVRYECAPTVGTSFQGATICFWNDDLTIGYVVLFDPSLDSRSVTAAAHDAVVS